VCRVPERRQETLLSVPPAQLSRADRQAGKLSVSCDRSIVMVVTADHRDDQPLHYKALALLVTARIILLLVT
jgi:hypothetical protein